MFIRRLWWFIRRSNHSRWDNQRGLLSIKSCQFVDALMRRQGKHVCGEDRLTFYKHSYIHKYIVLATWVSCNTYNSSNNEPTRSPSSRIPGIGTKFKYRLSGGKLSGSIEDVPHFRFWSEPFTVLGKNIFLYRLIVCIARMHNWFNYWR